MLAPKRGIAMTRTILIATTAVLLALAPANAGHIKPGRWHAINTIRYIGVDKFPAIMTGRLAAQGIVMPTRPVTTDRMVCITPDQAAIDRLPTQDQANPSCDDMTFEPTSDGYKGKSVCRGELEGRVWFEVSFKDDAHYEGKTIFKGTTYGLALETSNVFSGEFSNADCNATP
jgi:hypothetical protein